MNELKLPMKYFLSAVLSLLLLTSPLFGQSEKPQTIIIPTGSIGEMSNARIKILEKTLESKLDDYFAIVPKELFEEAQEQAFEELDYDECTEDQCIMKIKELLQIENAFKMDLTSEDGDTQISITWNDQEQKRVEQQYCEGCNTKGLILMIDSLVDKLVRNQVVEKKETATIPKTQTFGFSNSERMRVRFDSSLVGSHEGSFGNFEDEPKTLNLMTIGMIFKNNFGIGLSIIDWVGTTTKQYTYYTRDYKKWGVSGNFLDAYYVFEETNPNTYWIDKIPLSMTLGTSFPVSLEMTTDYEKDSDPTMSSKLISIGAKVSDNFELILNRSSYNFGGILAFKITVYTMGIGYLF